MSAGPRISLLSRLAVRDLLHGWQTSICFVTAVTVALIPILVLFGLKSGVVDNLLDALRSDPRINEIRLNRDQPLDADWFSDLSEDPRVGFLLPESRHLATGVRVRGPDRVRRLDSRLIPSAPGDPLLVDLPQPEGYFEVVITERVAIEANVGVGEEVEFEILRENGESREVVRHVSNVIGIIPRNMLQTDDIVVDQVFENAVANWREGFSVPALDWAATAARAGESNDTQQFASFRLYAGDVRDVLGLRDRLLQDGLDVQTRASDIEQTLLIERALGWVFLIISSLTAFGFVLTLGLHLTASIAEKARELSLLRLLGLSSVELSLMPSIQGLSLALVGSVGGVVLVGLAAPLINAELEGLAGLTGDVYALSFEAGLIAILGTTFAGALAGVVAGYRAAALEPVEGLRYE